MMTLSALQDLQGEHSTLAAVMLRVDQPVRPPGCGDYEAKNLAAVVVLF
jgi:hypothetical protein